MRQSLAAIHTRTKTKTNKRRIVQQPTFTSPRDVWQRLHKNNPRKKRIIHKLCWGGAANSSPRHVHHRTRARGLTSFQPEAAERVGYSFDQLRRCAPTRHVRIAKAITIATDMKMPAAMTTVVGSPYVGHPLWPNRGQTVNAPQSEPLESILFHLSCVAFHSPQGPFRVFRLRQQHKRHHELLFVLTLSGARLPISK